MYRIATENNLLKSFAVYSKHLQFRRKILQQTGTVEIPCAGHVGGIVCGEDGKRKWSFHGRAEHLPQLPGRPAEQGVGRGGETRASATDVDQLRQDPQVPRQLHGTSRQVHVRGAQTGAAAHLTPSRPLSTVLQGQFPPQR